MKKGDERASEKTRNMPLVQLDVLLAVHDDLISDIVRTELIHYKANAHSANELEEVFVIIEGEKLDVAFVDVDHPGLDPRHIITALRRSSSNSKIPVVALVPSNKIDLLEQASRAGASHFLIKPIVRQQLHELMQHLHWNMADDHRRYRRAKADFPILCSVEGMQIVAHSINVSSGGMLMKTDVAIPKGTDLTLAFPYSEQHASAFLLNARVARTLSDDQVGLEFVDMSAEKLEKLLMWVDIFYYMDKGLISK